MLDNIFEREGLRGLARARARVYETKTVHPLLADEAVAAGWELDKRNRKSVRVKRRKSHGASLEDRVWSLLYRTGFTHLSGAGGSKLTLNPKDAASPTSQIDVVGIDDELALAIECKSSERYEKRPQFQKDLARHSMLRDRFANAVSKQYPVTEKRQVVLAMFLDNIALSDNDRARAREENILLFDERDLTYYEALAAHLGPAAKYQLFADMLPGKTVPGLTLRVPAVRTKIGGTYCYTFSISPAYLLKISYVSHRSKGKASDVHTYQRMLSKSRLNKIRQYISNQGIFPTNIVVNLEPKRVRFERIQQDEQDNGVLGWLEIRPAYKSAWIIDGQHRLFAYSGHDLAGKSRLAVLAFEGLSPSKQAGLFIDINAKQKSVKQSLLQELYAELHWDADEPEVRIRAIVSKAVQVLDADPESALYQRIQTADVAKDEFRCITLTAVYGAIEKTEFHLGKVRKGHVLEYGPLWAGDDNEATLDRTVYILKQWFNAIRARVPDWWDKGAAEGGGLAMNDGVTTCINVLRSVFQHQLDNGVKLIRLDNEDLFDTLKRYADALGDHFASFSEEGRKTFRDLRGIQGQTRRTRLCQLALRERFSDFKPAGLDDFLKQEKAQTNSRAKEIVDRIETTLQSVVLDELKRECGPDESQWWTVGVPKNVRLKVMQRYEEEDGKRGGRECYFDLIDYRTIAVENWPVFEGILGFGKSGSKEKRTAWMAFVNEKRKIVAHPSAAVTISIEDLNQLQEYESWLATQIEGSSDLGNESALARA